VGLLLSGFFFTIAVNRFGVDRFRVQLVNANPTDIHVGRWYNVLFKVILPAEFLVMLAWWFFQSITVYEPRSWWNPLKTYSLGTCLFQWGIVILVLILLNGKIVARIRGE
jgi:NSS family neurotransmitter:Na+ symporter